jgi:hypothetical protein
MGFEMWPRNVFIPDGGDDRGGDDRGGDDIPLDTCKSNNRKKRNTTENTKNARIVTKCRTRKFGKEKMPKQSDTKKKKKKKRERDMTGGGGGKEGIYII